MSSSITRKKTFEKVLDGYDVVLNSLGKDTLEKSLRVLKPGGKLISISGPPDPDFAKDQGLELGLAAGHAPSELWHPEEGQSAIASAIHFCFMRANGEQLSKITSLIESGIITPGHGSGLPVRSDQRGLGLRRNRTCKREGRHQGQIAIALAWAATQ